MRAVALVGVVLLVALSACHGGRSPVFTLYRSEAVGDSARIHVATFDAADDEESYNRDGCERTRELYQVQPSNRARFWCEPGRYKSK
jgi:hypothetical protein